ncbi:MAG: TIGR02452 family protein [Lachnospiraceae bacterium]|nr:TIGR02452 family protein [Lachnospiraceae bacterium]
MPNSYLAILEETLAILEQGYYKKGLKKIRLKLTRDQMEEAHVFLPEDIPALESRAADPEISPEQETGRCAFSCVNRDSFGLAVERINELEKGLPGNAGIRKTAWTADLKGKRVLVLNLANPVNPGGGVRRGARAQEEDLCRKSSLLVSVEGKQAAPYYEYNRKLDTYMGSDAVIIHPQVEIIRDEDYELMRETVVTAVMTCAAPMITYGLEGMNQEEYQTMVKNRITGMLKVAAFCGYRNLVLGAFGCGAFRNDAHVVSDLFVEAIKTFSFKDKKTDDWFDRIDFAVWDRSLSQYNYREFDRNFNHLNSEAASGCPEGSTMSLSASSDSNGNMSASSDSSTMSTSASWDSSASAPASSRPPVLFWHEYGENGIFSNWYQRSFIVDDVEYLHVEQYMMAQKALLFHDEEIYRKIMETSSPSKCKALGKEVRGFDSEVWNAHKFEIVRTAVYAKFEQHPDLLEMLLATGDAVMAEASPKDHIWGIGLDAEEALKRDPAAWPGENLLGKALMAVREELRKEVDRE